jgi:uncharacterized protein
MPNTRTNTPRSALVFDMRTLDRQAGSCKTQELTVPAPDGLRLELVGVPAGAEMALNVKFEAVTEGILVTGSTTAPVAGECARCLAPLTDTVTASFTELYLYDDHPHGSRADRTARNDKHDKHDKHSRNDPRDWLEENSEPDDEELYLDGDLLDLEPVLRDAVVLALPMSPLCQEDCPGLCVECGVPLATAGPGHRHDGPLDPRWGALSKFDDQATRRADAIDLQEN